MKNKDLLHGFLAGAASTVAICMLALVIFTNGVDKQADILLNKTTMLDEQTSKVTSISYQIADKNQSAILSQEDFAFMHFEGVVIGCQTVMRGDCGISSKKDAETLIKVIQKSIELGWVK